MGRMYGKRIVRGGEMHFEGDNEAKVRLTALYRKGCEMSDYGDMCREMRDFKKQSRERFGIPCPECSKKLPKADPTILLPQQVCKIHGYRDLRTWQGIANELQDRIEQLTTGKDAE